MYPNGLDPGARRRRDRGRPDVGRARRARRGPSPGSTRVLELGIDRPGAGRSRRRDTVASSGKTTDVALAADAHGALWVAWVDGAGSWLERVVCRWQVATPPLRRRAR